MLHWIVLLACISLLSAADYMDQCMDGKHHKKDPGPEGNLYGKCSPWQSKSCCTVNVSEAAHMDQSYLYNFDWNHCGVMSDECKTHFIHDTCFYECSPNLGPWIQWVDQSWRKERIVDVPLCIEDCETWYKDCSGEYTCMENWHKGWDWSTGMNRCPAGKGCRKFTDVFPSAKDFCEKVWSNSYKYTTHKRNSGLCMQLWFENGTANPNVAVAKYYADLLNSAETPRPWLLALLAPLCVFWDW